MEAVYNQLMESKDEILNNFMEKYFFVNKDLSQKSLNRLVKIFDKTLVDFINEDYKSLRRDYETLSNLGIKSNIPYVVLMHELEFIKNRIITLLFEKSRNVAVELCKVYNEFETIIAGKYLDDYIKKLRIKNRLKIDYLNGIEEKEVVRFYEAHLHWLDMMLNAVEKLDPSKIPPVDPQTCEYGHWLHSRGKKMIKNDVQHTALCEQHAALHHIADKLHSFLTEKNYDYQIFMTYVEKAELISLDMGTELAMIDNSVMISKSSKDSLTGCLNRNLLEGIFTHQYELAVATAKPFVIAMCDLDDFKHINDTYGHVAGDQLLKGFASLALGSLRASDIMIRYGGEEFVFIIPAVEEEKGVEIFDKIRERFENYRVLSGKEEVKTTVSIGVKEVRPKESINISDINVSDFIREADEQMYLAKRGGKNRVR